MEAVEVVHALPERRTETTVALRVHAESDVRHGLRVKSGFQVLVGRVCLVRRHLPHDEVLRRGLDERGELRTVSPVAVSDFNRRDDVGFYSRADVNLNPLLPLDAPRRLPISHSAHSRVRVEVRNSGLCSLPSLRTTPVGTWAVQEFVMGDAR